jgi:hypothetical protein
MYVWAYNCSSGRVESNIYSYVLQLEGLTVTRLKPLMQGDHQIIAWSGICGDQIISSCFSVPMLICQFLRYPPGTHFMELKVIMHHRIDRPNADIQFFLQFCRTFTLLFSRISSLGLSPFCVAVAVVGWPEHSVSVKRIQSF